MMLLLMLLAVRIMIISLAVQPQLYRWHAYA